MAKTRLTNDSRRVIARKVIEYKFAPIEAALRARENELAQAAWDQVHGPFKKEIAKLPAGALKKEDDVYVNVGGHKHDLDFKEPVGCFYCFDSYSNPLVLKDPDVIARAQSWAAEKDQAKTDRRDLERKVEALLASFRTFEDAVAGWPDAAGFIAAELARHGSFVDVPSLPSVKVEDVSRALGLPPETDLAEAA